MERGAGGSRREMERGRVMNKWGGGEVEEGG